jgi:hypothetical protein
MDTYAGTQRNSCTSQHSHPGCSSSGRTNDHHSHYGNNSLHRQSWYAICHCRNTNWWYTGCAHYNGSTSSSTYAPKAFAQYSTKYTNSLATGPPDAQAHNHGTSSPPRYQMLCRCVDTAGPPQPTLKDGRSWRLHNQDLGTSNPVHLHQSQAPDLLFGAHGRGCKPGTCCLHHLQIEYQRMQLLIGLWATGALHQLRWPLQSLGLENKAIHLDIP